MVNPIDILLLLILPIIATYLIVEFIRCERKIATRKEEEWAAREIIIEEALDKWEQDPSGENIQLIKDLMEESDCG